MTKIKNTIDYFVFIKQGYDRQYYCVAGREINYNDAICFLTNKEAVAHAESKSKALHEPRSTGQGKASS
jgi:hypothetical protein